MDETGPRADKEGKKKKQASDLLSSATYTKGMYVSIVYVPCSQLGYSTLSSDDL
jgi:hypothetical protein